MNLDTHALGLVNRTLVEEIEPLLDSTLPQEAEATALYVDIPASFGRKSRGERMFGIPGAGLASLKGPQLVGLVALVAKSYLEQQAKKEGPAAVPSLPAKLELLAEKLSGKEPAVDVEAELEGVAAITRSLIAAGWEPRRAEEAAKRTFLAGLIAGQRLAAAA